MADTKTGGKRGAKSGDATTRQGGPHKGVLTGPGGGDGGNPGKKKKAPKKKTVGDPVSVATGDVVEEILDLYVPGIIPFAWERTYDSSAAGEATPLGRGGWTHAFHQFIALEEGKVVLHNFRGSVYELAQPEALREAIFHRAGRFELTRTTADSYLVRSLDSRLVHVYSAAGGADAGRLYLTEVRDPHGSAISLHYERGVLARLRDTAGRDILVQSDAHGRIARVEIRVDGRLAAHVDYAYTDEGELACVKDALGHAFRYAYDGKHRLLAKTRKTGVSFHFRYDADTGRCTKAWGDGGLYAVELEYDVAAGTTTTHGTREPRIFTWDENGSIVREATLDGSFVEETAYDADLFVVSKTNAAGESEAILRDDRGNVIATTDCAGNVTKYTYQHDRPVRVDSPDGTAMLFAYDGFGDLLSVTQPTGLTFSVARDGYGQITGLYGPDGQIESRGYDARHDNVTANDARGAAYTWTYDDMARTTSRTDSLGRTFRAEYDALGQVVTIHRADGTRIDKAYDAGGEVTRIRTPTGQILLMEYVGTGVLSKVTGSDGQVWRITYDRDERPIAIENPRGERYEFRYDAAGRVIEERTFDGRTMQYQYARSGRMSRVENPDGTWRAFFYDPLGNVLEETSSHGTQSFVRDAMGRILEATLDEGAAKITTLFERDALGRVLVETQDGQAIHYAFDARGRRASRTLPSGETTRYRYDVLEDLAGIDHEGHTVSITRDALGRETKRTIDGASVAIESRYDAHDRVLEQRASAPAPAGGALRILAHRAWTYDALGRVARVDDERWGPTAYTYDEASRLLEARSRAHREVFDYDAAGAIQSIFSSLGGGEGRFAVGPGNRLLRTPDAEYTYDANGARAEKRELDRFEPTGKVTRYDWDCRGRLRQVTLPDGALVRYLYDAFGRRVRKEIRAHSPDPLRPTEARVVRFLWDVHVLCAELDSARGVRVFVHEPGTFFPLMQSERGEVFVYVNDALGTPRELIDAKGNVAWAATHSAWGRLAEVQRDVLASNPNAVESPFRLLGQYADEETGLAHTRYRYFDPVVGRWCSPDPLGIRGGPNLYGFEFSPTLFADPFGLASTPLGTAGGGGDNIVYGLFRPGESWANGDVPVYVGITNDEDVRRRGHNDPDERLGLYDLHMDVVERNLSYGDARASEEARIQLYDTLDGRRSSTSDPKPPGNQDHSIAPGRAEKDDARSEDLVARMEKKKAELEKEDAARIAKAKNSTGRKVK